MKIERVKFSDAVMVGGYEENILPNGRTPAHMVDIELDGDVFSVRHNGVTVCVPKSNLVYWIEAGKPAAKVASKQ